MEQKANANAVLFIICMSSVLVPFMSSALNLALPHINEDLKLHAVMSGWVQASYMLSTAIFQIPCARLADMFGRRKVFILGVVVFTVFCILSGFAYTGISLIAYRFFSGIGSAMMFGTGMAILTSAVAAEKRGWALGINTATVYFALASGPFFGGLLTEYFGWHSVFFASAMVSSVVAIGAVFIIKDDWKLQQREKFDYIGALLYAIGLSSLIYGFSRLPHVFGFSMIGAGIVLLLVFGMYEKKQLQPVFNIHVFLGNRIFRLSSLSALINYSATFAISFMLSLYLQDVRGLSPLNAGFILIVQSIVQAVVSLRSGRLSDKMPASLLATWGMGIIAVGLILLCFVTETTSYYLIGVILALLGLGFGIFSSPNMNVIMSSVDKRDYGLASATTGTMRLTGQAFSMGIAIMAISLNIGEVSISHEVHTQLMASMRMTFVICAALCLLGVYTSSARNKK